MFETSILAILQGISEFLPISSSGHLALCKWLLGMQDTGIRLDIFLHVGTLVAIVAFYWQVFRRILRERDWSYLTKIVLSAIPVCVVGLLFEARLEELFTAPRGVAVSLLFTGIILAATKILPKGDRQLSVGGAAVMGIAQMVAILPGVSRSGMTLAAAKVMKIDAAKAAEFSFLMSILPICGAAALQVWEAMDAYCPNCPANEPSWLLVIYGSVLAAVVGYFSLVLLLKALKSDKLWMFGPYCLVTGGVTLILT